MNKNKPKQRKRLLIALSIILAIAVVGGIVTWYFQIKKPHDKAVAAFDVAINALEEQNAALDKSIESVQTIIDSGDQPYKKTTLTAAKNSISSANDAKVAVPEMPKKTDDIISKTRHLTPVVNYTKEIKALSTSQEALKKSIQQYKQVTKPTKDFVIKRLKNIQSVSDVKAVTEDNDPNQQLGKQGGYTAAVYFISDQVKGVDGKDSIKKGTDGGGCIEVYASAKEAKQRDAYLSAFDGGAFSSGSHHVIGTVVIRTSAELTASQQKKLEKQITEQLIAIKN